MPHSTSATRATRGVFCALLGGFGWGFSGACGQYLFAHSDITPAALTAIRELGAGVVLLTFLLLRRRGEAFAIWRDKKSVVTLLLFALLGLLFCQYSYLACIAESTAGTATVLQYLGPVLVMLLACLRARSLPSGAEVAALALAVVGTFLLATGGRPGALVLSEKALFWGLAAAVGVVFYTVLPAGLIGRYGATAVTGFAMLASGLLLGSVIRLPAVRFTVDFSGALALAAIVLIGTVAAFTLYLQGVADIGPVRASVLASVEPVTATVLSVVWLGSSFSAADFAGFLCIFATVFLLARKKA
ncbi:MAG: DMT family transporter [Oscillospiraceae bacterium]|nr:DMT family transporter [Oscillospiraceae bacterium]